MLKVTLLGADGAYLSRSEIVSLYASDLNYVPYMRRASVQYDGSVELEVPQAPVMLHAKLNIPGYGYGIWDVGYGGQLRCWLYGGCAG